MKKVFVLLFIFLAALCVYEIYAALSEYKDYREAVSNSSRTIKNIPLTTEEKQQQDFESKHDVKG